MNLLIKSHKKVIIFILIIATAICLLVKCAVDKATQNQISTPNDVVTFLNTYGWVVEVKPTSTKTVKIPVKFSDVFNNYNELQKSQGYDLSKYRDEEVTCYTFNITNYKDENNVAVQNVNATVLVWQSKIIGGDISSLSISGFMYGFSGKK